MSVAIPGRAALDGDGRMPGGMARMGEARRRWLLLAGLLSWWAVTLTSAVARAQSDPPSPPPITPAGERLAALIDGMDVETHWIAKYHVDWRTGVALGPRETTPGGHTHCSAFAAALADRLGVYLLRPPEHRQDWLANAQTLWLDDDEGRAAGWRRIGRLADPGASLRAVAEANAGMLVLAVYFQPPRETPDGPKPRAGHVAIVRPSEKPAALIEAEGPDVAQAGGHNYRSVPLRQGFADHPVGLAEGSITYFEHQTGL